MNGESLEHNGTSKKILKNLKKYLTKSGRCAKLIKFAASPTGLAKASETESVPCKLNNVKTN